LPYGQKKDNHGRLSDNNVGGKMREAIELTDAGERTYGVFSHRALCLCKGIVFCFIIQIISKYFSVHKKRKET
jgi:hypothetical protein